jgi:lysyl-tRNA synthetase, class I
LRILLVNAAIANSQFAKLVQYAIHYFRDFVLPAKNSASRPKAERAALGDLRDALAQLRPESDA